jgi:hypothetical protein
VSDDSPKSDRATWIVPIVVALIAALGTVIAALAPSLLVPNDVPSTGPPAISTPPPAVAYQGEGAIRYSAPEVDLDSLPNGTGGDHVADLVHTPMALTTSKDSRIALLDRGQLPTPDVCRSMLAARGTSTVPVSQIETGVRLCITTTAGRTGAVVLNSVRKYGESGQLRLGEIKFSYSIWSLPAK